MVEKRILLARACALLVVLSSTGCAIVGPTALRGSRSAYNDAIVATNNQQVLAMIVRMRYGEPAKLLAVSSVTASMSIQASAGAQLGFGPTSNYEGNLVPLTAGLAYEENPTISYTPVEGEKYMRQLLSPLPLDLTVLLLRALQNTPEGATLLLRSINGIWNPDFLADPSIEVDPRFTRLAELLAELARQGRTNWVQASEAPPSYMLAFRGKGETFASQIQELYGLLGFEPPPDLNGVITLPVRLGVGRPSQPGISIETRSLFDLFNIVAASVQVPEEHLTTGTAGPLPPVGPAGQGIRVRVSKERPDEAMAAVRHHDWWYSIDGADAESKLAFRVVETLISVRIADSADHAKGTPVLTIPVSQ